jgi:antibiotic biosynthesis monooxygenase (ABM) superfamily enzyme
MITMRVAPARAAEFRAWQERLVIAESRFPGFLGHRFEQPLHPRRTVLLGTLLVAGLYALFLVLFSPL